MTDGPPGYRGDWQDGYRSRGSNRATLAVASKASKGDDGLTTRVLTFLISVPLAVGGGFLVGGLVSTLDLHPLVGVGSALMTGSAILTLLARRIFAGKGAATADVFARAPRPSLETPRVNTTALPATRADLVQSVLGEATAHLRKLDAALPQLRDFGLVASVAKMVAVGQRVCAAVAESPEKLAAAQRLFTFYCPKAVEVVDTLLEMQADPRPDAARLDATRDVLTKLELVFDRTELELKAMDGQVLDIDLRVLNQALDEDLNR